MKEKIGLKRKRFKSTVVVSLVLALVLAACGGNGGSAADSDEPITIGGISDLTGGLAPLGISQRQMAELAVKDINAAGGVLGRELRIEYVDGASDPAKWAVAVRELADYPLVIGALTGAERDAIKETVTKSAIYIQPTLTDGVGECLDNMYTVGPVPEQNMLPLLEDVLERVDGQRVYFVGSDYNFPREANRIVMEHLVELGGEVVGEDYFPLDATDFATAVKAIEDLKPDIVFSNVIPPSSFSLIRQMNEAGVWDDVIYATAGSDESWLFGVDPGQIQGMYSALDYYEALTDDATIGIQERYETEYGTEYPIAAAGGATGAYRGVQMWAAAVEAAGDVSPEAVDEAMDTISTDVAPGGGAEMVAGTRHAKVPTHIARFDDGHLNVLSAITPVRSPRACEG